MSTCRVTLRSKVIPGHTHACALEHERGDHMCAEPNCRRWFGLAGS
jgi:hypothetical protein